MEQRIWHKQYRPETPAEIDLEPVTMPEFLARQAKRIPKSDAMLYMGKHITYEELDYLAGRFAAGMAALGVGRGDKVAIALPNTPQTVIAHFGLWRLGAVPVACNPLYTDTEMEHQFKLAGVSAAVALDLLCPRLLALRAKTDLRLLVCCHINDYLPFPLRQLYPLLKRQMYRRYERQADYWPFMEVIANARGAHTGPPPQWDDLALIPFTGGTTGVSKGVMLTHANASSIVQILRAWFFDLSSQPGSELGVFPIFHISGFTGVLNTCVINGWSNILVPKPEPATALQMIIKYRPDLVPAVPTLYVGIMAQPEFAKADLSFVKGFFSGAAPLAVDTINDLKAATGGDIIEVYGMTESCALITATPWRGKLKPGSVGVPLPNTDVKLVDMEDGKTIVPVGEPGEIAFRGPQMCAGYYNMPAETAHAIRDGWFHTGDVAKMDEDGFLFIVDRTKDMIVASGFNIYPREIDEVLFEHPAVLEACAVGVPDDYRGETVKAFVVLNRGMKATAEELDQWCRQRLTPYKAPKLYEFVESLPKSAVGKILRRELRDREWAKSGRQRNV